MKNKLFYLSVLAGSLFLGGCTLDGLLPSSQPLATPSALPEPSIQEESVIKATFKCADDKSIQAEFTDGQVKLDLSDGRVWELPQAMSASGARYANEDETQVFWNKGDTAFIQENDQNTYSDCVTQEN